MATKRFLGRNARLYYSPTWDTPTWTRIQTRDTLSVGRSKTLEDVTAEDSAGEKWEQSVLNERSIEFDAFFNAAVASDTVYNALLEAYENDTELTVAVAMGDITSEGVKYRKMALFVTGFDEDLNAKGVGKVKVKLTPGPTANAPTTVTVPAS